MIRKVTAYTDWQSFCFNNDNAPALNQFVHDQRHRRDGALALSGETKHPIQGILKVQVYRYLETDHALQILLIGKYEVLFSDRFQPST